jgi:hypothetical protein
MGTACGFVLRWPESPQAARLAHRTGTIKKIEVRFAHRKIFLESFFTALFILDFGFAGGSGRSAYSWQRRTLELARKNHFECHRSVSRSPTVKNYISLHELADFSLPARSIG